MLERRATKSFLLLEREVLRFEEVTLQSSICLQKRGESVLTSHHLSELAGWFCYKVKACHHCPTFPEPPLDSTVFTAQALLQVHSGLFVPLCKNVVHPFLPLKYKRGTTERISIMAFFLPLPIMCSVPIRHLCAQHCFQKVLNAQCLLVTGHLRRGWWWWWYLTGIVPAFHSGTTGQTHYWNNIMVLLLFFSTNL